MDDSLLNLKGQIPPMSADYDVPSVTACQVTKTVLSYCFLIIVLPVLTFFTSKSVIFGHFVTNSDNLFQTVMSALLAIVVLHIGLAVFIYKASYADNNQEKEKVQKLE